jgi:hypothetical protein
MASMLNPIPTADAATTLGALLGPLGALAVGATLVALGILVVGLVLERREAAERARRAAEPPRLATGSLRSRPERHAA